MAPFQQPPFRSLLLLILCIPLAQHTTGNGGHYRGQKPSVYYIGGVLSTTSAAEAFTMEAQHIDYEHLYLPTNVSLYDSTQIMDSNPIKTAIIVCNKLIKERVYVIIVSKPENGELSPASVSYTAGFYHIPVLGISSRDSAFSDKNIHVSFLRTVPPYSHQADVWVELLKHFHYRQVVFIHSSDTDGRSLLGRFQTRAQDMNNDDQEIKVEKVEEFEPGQETYLNIIRNLKECQARVYFLYATRQDAEKIFADAAALNMTGAGYAWIVTEQALKSHNVPHGALGLQLTSSQDEKAHIRDALHILVRALSKLYMEEEDIEEAPSNCNSSGSIWKTGKVLFNYIREQKLEEGRTGKVAFDAMGDRLFAEYNVVNVQIRDNKTELEPVGNYSYSHDINGMILSIDEQMIIWPGGSRMKPTGVMIPTHLKVLTIVERPFVDYINNTSGCDKEKGYIECPEYVFQNLTADPVGSKYCCRGYCIDLLEKLSQKCNFTYDVYLSLDGDYGSLERNNNTGKQEWTGLIGELVGERADMIVAPLTINPERAQVMEFSKPFKYQGITILQKRQPRASQLVSFLQPFKVTLWVLVLVSVKVIAFCLYLLDRFSPFGRYNNESREQGREEESLNLTAAIWFAWGVLLNSGIGEGTPRSFSARVLGMVWAGFAMIIVASYTANLAAFLVLDKPQTSLTGINDPRLRNPMENFTYATVKGSSVDMYFRRQVELSNMYRTMEGKHYKTPELAIDAVINGSLKAFIWDSSRLEYEAARNCKLITAGELFGRSGYGVGLQKGSPWADQVTLAILDFHESGYMEMLDNRWILNSEEADPSCSEKDSNSPATLGLENMRGVFILVGVGIFGGMGLILVEVLYHKHKIRKDQRTQAARLAFEKWNGTVEKRKTLRETREGLRQMGHRPNGISRNEKVMSCDNLTNTGRGKKETRWQRVADIMRPRQDSGENLNCSRGSDNNARYYPYYMRSLPSTEFLRMMENSANSTNNTQQAPSPISPLSFDFNRKKKRRQRAGSPDILRRSSPNLAEAQSEEAPTRQVRLYKDYRHQSGMPSAPPLPVVDLSPTDYSSSDYAPVSTERWRVKGPTAAATMYQAQPELLDPAVPCPPPPPKKRVKGPLAGFSGAYLAGVGGLESPSYMRSGCNPAQPNKDMV